MNRYVSAVIGCVAIGFVGLIMLVSGLTSGNYLEIGMSVFMIVFTIILLELLNPNHLVNTPSNE